MLAVGKLPIHPNIDDIMAASPTHPSLGNSLKAAGHMNDLILEEQLADVLCESFFV